MITNPGGLWDESMGLYPILGGDPKSHTMLWTFLSGMRVKFAHLFEEKDVLNWQGAQIPYAGFDEVTHFTKFQFFYMLSRLRSMSGVPGRIRATCNPDPDSWVADFIAWWIDQETGFPIPERVGKLRWFVRDGDEMIWGNTKQGLLALQKEEGKTEIQAPKSVTFIPAKVQDNKILMEKDPAYIGNLQALSLVERARLLGGNWKIRPSAGNMFRRSWFEYVDAPPVNIIKRLRYWDRAATKPANPLKPVAKTSPDWTAGLLLLRDGNGVFYVAHVERFQETPLKVKERIRNIATGDGVRTSIGLEQDPGQAGVAEVQDVQRFLAGFITKAILVQRDKVTRANPVSAQSQTGNIKIVKGAWNKTFLDELEAFPTEGVKDDQVDAFSGAFNLMMGVGGISWLAMMQE